jgi:type II secretory pathway predicted ATPase ExeA
MTVAHRPPPYDLANPPAGVRLELGRTAASLKVSVRDMAAAVGISSTAVADLLSNKWPAKTPRQQIEASLRELLQSKGATEEDLATLFHAQSSGPNHPAHPGHRRDRSTDSYGRPLHAEATPPEEDPTMIQRQTLSPAARRAFKLFANPFEGEVLRENQMFVGDDIAYVREAAWQCAQTGGFAAIVGESGAGKTTIVTDLEERLKAEARDVVIIKPSVLGMEESESAGHRLKSADILHAICHELEPLAPVPQTLQARTVKAKKLLAGGVQTGSTYLLVVEEAHSMPDATLKHLKRLHELREGRRGLLGILLLAQPELKLRLASGLRSGTLREVAQRCEIVELLPLDSDLKGYLEKRAAAGGVQLGTLIDDAAIEALRTRLTRKVSGSAVSMCYPLAVNNMVTKALNAAADLGEPRVTKDVISHI